MPSKPLFSFNNHVLRFGLETALQPPSLSLATLIVSPPATKHWHRLVQAGYRVISVLGRVDGAAGVLRFDRPNVADFSAALQTTMGLSSGEAELQARSVGCSVTIWHVRTLFTNRSQPNPPSWADAEHIDAVIAAVFAGTWRQRSERDMTVMTQLAQMQESHLANVLSPFALCTAPLFERVGSDCLVIAPTAAFQFVLSRITPHHLHRLRQVCTDVFSQVSQAAAERWQGQPRTPGPVNPQEHVSEALREGLAETLLRIAVLGDPLLSNGALDGTSCEAYVSSLVQALPGLRSDARMLASLDRQLPHLLEAAPEPFLDALDTLIQGEPHHVSTLLADEAGIFGRALHVGLLWGLEGLAWSMEHLPRASRVLAALAELDPGGQLSNRPFNSLCEIFLPWNPSTAAPLGERLAALDGVVRQHPVVGWRLLIDLLPGKRRTSVPTHRPRWRNWGQVKRDGMVRREVQGAVDWIYGRAIGLAEGDPEKLSQILERYNELSAEQRDRLEGQISTVAQHGPSLTAMQQLRGRIERLCRRHATYSHTEWALEPATVERLLHIATQLPFEDPVAELRWLFDEQFPDVGNVQASHEQRRQLLDQMRHDAIGHVREKLGWDGVLRLVDGARYSYIVGHEAGACDVPDTELLASMESWFSAPTFSRWAAVRSASSARHARHGDAWTDALIAYASANAWPALALATALADFPDDWPTYRRLERLSTEVRGDYWKLRYAYVRPVDDDVTVFAYAVTTLLEHGRAFDVIQQNWHDLPKLGSEQVMAVLDGLFEKSPTEQQVSTFANFEHSLQHVFDWLREQPEVDTHRLAQKEYGLVQLLTDHGSTPTDLALHLLMRTQPAYFVEFVCDVYRPESKQTEQLGEDDEAVQARARHAYQILEAWHIPPGIVDGVANEQALASWIDEARTLLREHDRVTTGEQTIGKVLFHLPSDPGDECPLPYALRQLLEVWQSEQLERGYQMECFNARGVTSRGLTDGGEQERKLERRWRAHAATIGAGWPRARRLCSRIADLWASQARTEDLDAQRERLERSR